jgi:hypothetical protein
VKRVAVEAGKVLLLNFSECGFVLMLSDLHRHVANACATLGIQAVVPFARTGPRASML